MSLEEPGRALRVHHLAVKVRDLARAEAFYAGALGLPVMRRQADGQGPRAIWLALGEGAFLAIERADAGEPARADAAPGWHCIALGIDVAEREGWRARLAQRGHPIVRETAYTLYVRDPEGAIVALSHYPHAIAEGVQALAPATTPAGNPDNTATPARPIDVPASPIEAGPDTAAEGRGLAGVTSRLAALVTLSAAVLVLLANGAPAAAQRRDPDVLLVGSSSVFGPLGVAIAGELERAGLRVRRIGRRSSGFARPDFYDWQAQIPRLGDLRSMRGVIVHAGANDVYALRLRREESRDRGAASWVPWTDEARWTSIYEDRVRAFVDGLCDAGAQRVVVIIPTDVDRPGWDDRIARVQNAQLRAVPRSRCGTAIDSRSASALRAGDTLDGVHLSTRGARALLTRIAEPLIALFRG